jgi:hypothetical protein
VRGEGDVRQRGRGRKRVRDKGRLRGGGEVSSEDGAGIQEAEREKQEPRGRLLDLFRMMLQG